MVDTANIKSNFVKGLEENNNRILTYVTIFFTFAFLGCLIVFWIYEHRSSRCVFGPACCHTDLVNRAPPNTASEVILFQSGTSTNWGASAGVPEIITFEASKNDSNDKATFFADLYRGSSASVTKFPDSTSNSGYYVNTQGVSIYFGDYYTKNWSHSHVLVQEGLSQFIATSSIFHAGPSPAIAAVSNLTAASPGGIVYNTGSATFNDGYNTVKSSLTQKTSFFSNFQNTDTGGGAGLEPILVVNTKGAATADYNPFMDFLHTKNMVKASNGCSTDGLSDCICTDPSSKNLPSCRSPYIKGKGYLILDQHNKAAGFSQNCSHSYFAGVAVTATSPNSVGSGAVQELIPRDSSTGTKLGIAFPTGAPPTSAVNIDLGGKPIGKTANPGTGTDSYKNAFVSRALFCGSNTSKVKPNMYAPSTTNTNVNATEIIDGMKKSTVPNAKALPNGVFQLGFG